MSVLGIGKGAATTHDEEKNGGSSVNRTDPDVAKEVSVTPAGGLNPVTYLMDP